MPISRNTPQAGERSRNEGVTGSNPGVGFREIPLPTGFPASQAKAICDLQTRKVRLATTLWDANHRNRRFGDHTPASPYLPARPDGFKRPARIFGITPVITTTNSRWPGLQNSRICRDFMRPRGLEPPPGKSRT